MSKAPASDLDAGALPCPLTSPKEAPLTPLPGSLRIADIER